MTDRALDWLSRALRREVVVGRRAVAAIGVGAMVMCLALGAEARFYLPGSDVPVTLQTFFVLVAGAGLGPELATVACSAYLALGAVGIPIFAGGWLGPTTGYLVGFVAGAWAVARIVRAAERPGTARLAVAMAIGSVVIYLCGAAWLVCLGRPAALVLHQGVLWFLPGDALKLAAAVAFCRAYRERLRALFP